MSLAYYDEQGRRLLDVDYANGYTCPDYVYRRTYGVDEACKAPQFISFISAVNFKDGSQYITTGPQDENIADNEYIGDMEGEIASYEMTTLLSLGDFRELKNSPWSSVRRYIAYTEEEKESFTPSGSGDTGALAEKVDDLEDAMNSLVEAFDEVN